MADSLASLAAELRGMSARDRRAILHALTAAEQAAVEQAMIDRPDTVEDADLDRSEAFSPSFAACIARARAGPSGTMTVAARQALIAAADAVDPARALTAKPGSATAGRSLLDAFGGMLAPRTPRP